mgnify:CR=1 FL=1
MEGYGRGRSLHGVTIIVVAIVQKRADYHIAKSLEQRVRTSEQAITNISTANNMMKVADSSVNSAINVLQKMRELAVRYYDGSLSDDQKDAIKDRLNAMGLEVQQILDDGIFNGHEIFDKNEQTFTYHVGSDSNDQLNVNMPAVELDLSKTTNDLKTLLARTSQRLPPSQNQLHLLPQLIF